MSIFLIGGIVSCAHENSQENTLEVVRAHLAAREHQRLQYDARVLDALATQLQAFNAKLVQLEQVQSKGQHEVAQTAMTAEELRMEIQRLHGTIQEVQHRMQQGTTPPAQHPVASRPPPASETSPSGDAAERLYQYALQEYQQGNHKAAVGLFKQFLEQEPHASRTVHARYWLGESFYAQQQYEAAIVAFDEIIQKYPEDPKVPAALLKQGDAFVKLHDACTATYFLRRLQKEYPNSSEAHHATEQLKRLKCEGYGS
jgi:tol-pal system protein YbgF